MMEVQLPRSMPPEPPPGPILLPLVYDRREWNAMFVASRVAQSFGANLVLFHIILPKQKLDPDFREEVKTLERRIGVQSAIASLRSKTATADEIAQTIVLESMNQNAQGIIMPCAREATEGRIASRVAEGVVLKNPTRTILVSSPESQARINGNPRKVVVLVKPSGCTRDTLRVAVSLSGTSYGRAAELVAAQGLPLPSTPPLDPLEYMNDLKAAERRLAEQVNALAGDLGQPFLPRTVNVSELGRDLASFSAREGADVQVMTGRRTNLFSGIFGKDSSDILRNSKCPTIVVFGSWG